MHYLCLVTPQELSLACGIVLVLHCRLWVPPVQTKGCRGHSGHNFGLQGQNWRLVCIFLPFDSQRFLFEQPLRENIVQILLLAFNVASRSNFRESPASQVGLGGGVGYTWQSSCWEDFCSHSNNKLRWCPNPEVNENKIGGTTSFHSPGMVWVSNAVLG